LEAIRTNRTTGFALGGSTSPTPNTQIPMPIISQSDPELKAMLLQLNKKLDQPFKSYVVYTELKDVDDRMNEINTQSGK
jgi:hypothetical protein